MLLEAAESDAPFVKACLWLVFAALIGFVAFGEVPTIGVILSSFVTAGAGVILAVADPASRTDAAP